MEIYCHSCSQVLFLKDFLISHGCVCTIIDSPPFVSTGSIEINHGSERDIIKLCYFPFAVAIILSRFCFVTYYHTV